MYIWKIDNLIEDLKNNNVSQKEQFKYALTLSIFMGLAADPSLSIGVEYGIMDFISTVAMLVITIFGLAICYKANKSADDKDFILRFFTMGLPITVRFIVIVVPIAIVASSLEAALDPNYDIEAEYSVTSIYQVLLMVVFEIVFYLYFASKFKHFTQAT